MEVDVGLDLLHATDHPAVDEVAQRLRLGCGERRRPPVGLRRGGAGRAAAATPVVGPVAVQVGADVGRTAVGLPVLAPGPVRPGGDVVLAAVRVDRRHDPDLPAVDDVGDPGVGAVAVGEEVEQVDRHLDGQVLTGVLLGVEQDLRLVLVGADVVGDLHRHQVAALVRRTDADLAGDRRMVGDDLVHDGGQFRVVVVVGVGRREGQSCRSRRRRARRWAAGPAAPAGSRACRSRRPRPRSPRCAARRVRSSRWRLRCGPPRCGRRGSGGRAPGSWRRPARRSRSGAGRAATGPAATVTMPSPVTTASTRTTAERDGRAEGHGLPPRWAGDPAR